MKENEIILKEAGDAAKALKKWLPDVFVNDIKDSPQFLLKMAHRSLDDCLLFLEAALKAEIIN